MVNGCSFMKRLKHGKLLEPQGKGGNAGIAPGLPESKDRKERQFY